MATDTAKRLSQISDDGLFERLATAVLREADPRYSNLAHPGVNVDGKAVKAPLDGIVYIPGTGHLIAVHHTTTKASDLKSKWLHDPATVVPRKGGRPTAPAGDLVKTAVIVAEERNRFPQLEATLVLTTNQEPSVDVVREVQAAAQGQSIIVDLWSQSRLAHFLDKPEGQWIRHTYLGTEPEHLSRELLGKLSLESAQNSKPIDDQEDGWIDRSLDQALDQVPNGIVFVVAESGFGKSVACYKKLLKHITHGGFGIILPHELLESSLNVYHAIDAALHQLHPYLVPNAASEVRLLCGSTHPFLIVVEDINRSGRGAHLLEKLASWSKPDVETSRAWQLLCPLWPELMVSLNDQARKRVETLSISCAALTTEEARRAVQRRALLAGRNLSDMDADSIASALGHDPLLIALHDPNKTPDAYQVVDVFVKDSLSRTASKHPEFTAPDYHAGVLALSEQMLAHRQLEPGWNDIVAWFGLSDGVTNILRRLLGHGEIIRLAPGTADARLRFRHDRVRESLLSSAVADMIRGGMLEGSILADPFFAEIIGGALTNLTLSEELVDNVERMNPLALFFALRRTGKQGGAGYSAILKAINSWLDRQETHNRANQNLRWQALWVLSQTESPDVVALTKRFQGWTWNAAFARLRNGDVSGAIEICANLEPGSSAPWRDIQFDHAKMRFGKNLTTKLAEILPRQDLTPAFRAGALRFAGHLADPSLSDAITASWAIDPQRDIHLEDYLWAGAECCGDDPTRLLEPVCDAWAVLPSEGKEKHSSSPRDSLAAHNARFAFSRWPPIRAIRYLIQRAQQPELNWPIQFLLSEVDNPDVREFVAKELAKRQSTFLMLRPSYGPMSAASKARLLSMWSGPHTEKQLRERSFWLWSASEGDGDVEILRRIGADDALFDHALFERVKRGDHESIRALIEKLQTNEEAYWWQAGRHLWSDQMTEALDESLARRGQAAKRDWTKPEQNADWIVSENLLRLPRDTAERLLLKHWDHLRFVPYFIQAALYTATPQLRALVAETIAECPDPTEMMKYIDTHYNINFPDRPGVTDLAQVESLVPYFKFFSDFSIDSFWRVCNARGWFDFRRQHLDPLVSLRQYSDVLGGEHTVKVLDEFLEKEKAIWIDRWLERYLEAGANVDQITRELSKWLASKPTIGALGVVANALVQIGRRSDLAILSSVDIEPRDTAAQIVADATFAVMRRTLH
jgi:hypothetical protein